MADIALSLDNRSKTSGTASIVKTASAMQALGEALNMNSNQWGGLTLGNLLLSLSQ